MNTNEPHKDTPKFLDTLSSFLTRHRTMFVAALIVIAVGVVGLFVYLEITSNRNEHALVLVEKLQEEFVQWTGQDDATKATGYEDLVSRINDIESKYSRSYAAQRAIYINATALADLQRWDDASVEYHDLSQRFPDSYLAPISLTQAAVTAENADDFQRALELLTYLVDNYDSESAEIPRALFSIGRINESLDNIVDAASSYGQLIDDYPNSGWTNLARDRIITLTVQGRIGS